MLVRMKRNRNAHTTARGNINCRTDLESTLAKLSKFKDAYNQSYDPTTLLQCIYLRNSQMYTEYMDIHNSMV